MARRKILTSESVTEGHPDKMMDQVSDAVLDAALKQDPYSRVAIESVAKTGFVLLAGELTTTAQLDFQKIVRDTVREIGYTHSNTGFDADTCAVMLSISQQSPDIHLGVKNLQEGEVGAGDQGLMFGYATNETPELMPLPIVLSHKLTQRLAAVRKNKTLPYLGPDGKSQVSVEYVDEKPTRVTTIVVSSQHDADIPLDQLRADIKEHVIPVCKDWIDDQTIFHINPTGRFVLGGPAADAGLTGRKIIVDTYGGLAPHGGGAFSGKDPTKVDRSAAYLARYIAKNIVAAGLADRCEVQLAYAIGVAEPVSVAINTFGTHKLDEQAIEGLVRKHFTLTPAGIIRHLDLLRPIYKKTAAYGHFGRNDPDFTWEKTDKAEELKQAAFQVTQTP